MNMRHSYLYGTAGLSKWELEHPDPIDPDADNYGDVTGNGEQAEKDD